MARAVESAEWDRTSFVLATLANANRDDKKHPKPFLPDDFHPFRQEEQTNNGPDWAQINQIKRQYKVTKLHGRKRDQSGGSLPDAGREGPGVS